jgi:biopolymer transport protein ExbB
MKKILILTACISTLLAEDPVLIIPFAPTIVAEDQNSSIEVAQPVHETETQTVQIAAPELPTQDVPEAVIQMKAAELSTESPAVEVLPVESPKGLTDATVTPTIVEQTSLDLEEDIAAIEKEEQEVAEAVKSDGIIIDLGQVFAGSPTIYMVLFTLSVASIAIWAYALLSLRTQELLPEEPLKELRVKLAAKNYKEALSLCEKNPTILFQMLSTGIQSRSQGQSSMLELMKSEGRRSSTKLWQKTSLLNDIAVIAPMIGLLGTVLGMFYAFYDLNRSMESISALFDGLGVSVGTTVGGLIVAILALCFHAITKYRLTRQLAVIESQAHSLANLIDTQG